jgi:hypothetical protein
MGYKLKDDRNEELERLKSIIKAPPIPFFCKRHGFNVRVCRLTSCDQYPCSCKV